MVCASTSVSAVWTPESEPAISDAFAIDAPVLGTSVPEVFDALDTTLLKIVDEYSTPTGDNFLLWHARLGHFSRDRVVGALRYKGYAFRPGSDRCIMRRVSPQSSPQGPSESPNQPPRLHVLS